MIENKIVWHPYPKEKPTKDGFYMVTIDANFIRLVTDDYWKTDEQILMSYWKKYHNEVIAFSELVEPYIKGGE